MANSKKRQSLRGAVLIMILTVMVVLIIMLMATLTVVTTAGQRVYTKYEENQAYYTARSALDVFTQNMLNDNNYVVSGVSYSYTDDDGTVKTVPMKQGLALQLDVYKIKSQCDYSESPERVDAFTQLGITDEADKLAALGFAENMYESDKVFGTAANIPENTNFSVSTVALNAESTTDYIEYTVTFPAMTDGTNNYNKLVDDNTAKIRVEVLSRVYNTSPAYSEKDMMNVIKNGSPADKQALKDAIKAGNRSKDRIRLKVTSTVEFMDVEGTSVLVYDTQTPPIVNSSRAVTTFGGTNLKNMNIVGGVSTVEPVNWGNTGSIYGAIYAEDYWNNTSQSAQIYLTDNECYYIGGNATADNSGFKVKSYALTDTTDKDARPFVYIDGGGFGVSNSQIGGTAALDAEKVDLIIRTDPTDLTQVGIKGYNAFNVNGDVYCKGSVDISGYDSFTVNGDLYIDGAVTISGANHKWELTDGKLLFNGVPATNVYLSKVSTVNGVAATSITDGVAGTFDPFDFTTDKVPTTPDIDIELPNGVKKVITTHATMYNQYYQIDSTGAIKLDGSGNPMPITAEQKAFTTSQADLNVGNYSTKQFTATDIGTTGTLSCLANNGGTVLTTVDSEGKSTVTAVSDINTAGNKLAYVLSENGGDPNKKYGGAEGGDTSTYWYIHGGGTVELLLEPGTYYGNIVVADDTTLIMYAPSGTYKMDKLAVWTETVYNAYVNGTSIDVGMYGDNLKAPRIFYYFSDGATFSAENMFFMTGYFYGPGASIDPVKQKYDINMQYNDNPIGAVGVSFIGSVLCKDLKYENALGGVAYINPDADSVDHGNPILGWLPFRYTRN